METPSSKRIMSRTAPFGPVNSSLKPPKENILSSAKKLRGGSRRALLDVTNDSPIVGLALERNEETESPASITKRRPLPESIETPRIDSIKPPTLCHFNEFVASPNNLLAPTTTNTPDAIVVYSAFATDSSSLLTNKSDHAMEERTVTGMRDAIRWEKCRSRMRDLGWQV
eukprot:Gb_36889 [translate_table: standard]